MKAIFTILAIVTLILVGCAGKSDPVTTAPSDITFSPVFPDGKQMYSTDAGATWQYVPTLSKLMGCSCDCSYNGKGTYPGSCTFGGQDYSCNDWCTYGVKR